MKMLGAVLVAFCCGRLWAAEQEYAIRIEARNQALRNVIVAAPVTDRNLPEHGVLKSTSGQTIRFDRNPLGQIVFVVPHLEARSVTRLAVSAESAGAEVIQAQEADGKVAVSQNGKKVFTYQGRETPLPRPEIKPIFRRGGYIHPVFSPSGRLVTDDYPPNHVHHHGIWAPWTKTEFEGRAPDFWNMGEGTGTVEFARFGKCWSGAVQAGFQAEHRFLDLTSGTPKTALEENWTVLAYAIPGADYFVFDLISTQRCATASPLKLPKYYYGGMGFRGHWDWNGAKNAEILTANGETDRVKANETRANWCHIGGEVEGAYAGVTILCHPENFRAPQPMRVHPKEPFFCYAPSQVGDWQIEQSKPYVARYRFIVSDGRPEREKLDEIWRAYAHAPMAVIEKR